MFTENIKPRGRGRPPGQTAQGAAARQRLYDIAIRLMAEHGYEATTLRDVAKEAGVSVGLLYRYFPNKRAVIIALYDELSVEYARQAQQMPRGKWRDRFVFALKTSLQVLEPHRVALRALIPVLVGDPEEGVFAESAAFSRVRVQGAFEAAVTGSTMRLHPRSPPLWAGCCIWRISRCCSGGCWTRVQNSARPRLSCSSRSKCCHRWRSACVCRLSGGSWCRQTNWFEKRCSGNVSPATVPRMSIYVEILIRAPMDALWAHTQTPALHEQWDLRFSRIDYLPKAHETEPQRFRYTTRIGFGVEVSGEGETVGQRDLTDGSRSSALKFGFRRTLVDHSRRQWVLEVHPD